MKLEWNAGGWFGAQLGGTAWILVAAALAAAREVSTGLLLLTIFVIPNLIGYILWRSRKISCYAAIQIMVGIMGLCSLLAIYVLERAQLWREIQSGGSVSVLSAYLLVSVVIGILMLIFYVRFGRDKNGPAT